MKTDTKRCAIYSRVSTEMQANKNFNSCESQTTKIKSFIDSRENMMIIDQYSDEGYSGASMNRPNLQRLLQDVKNGKIDVVISYKIDRLSRNPRNFYYMIDLFDKCGVEFVSITEMFDTSSAAGRLLRNIMLVFAEFERELISERTRHKLEERAKKGMWNGGAAPLGYECKNKRLIVVDEDAKIVEIIFEKFLENKPIIEIFNLVNQIQNRTGRVEKIFFDEINIDIEKIWEKLIAEKIIKNDGKITVERVLWDKNFAELGDDKAKQIKRIIDKNKLIRPKRIMAILTNVVYTGKIVFKGEVIDGMHEPIIKKEVFDAVQKLKNQKEKHNEQKFKLYKNLVFGGLVRCRECGLTMTKTYCNKHTGDKLKRYFYYRCNKLAYVSQCSTSQISAEKLRKEVVQNLERIVSDEMYLENFALRLNYNEMKKFGKSGENQIGQEVGFRTFEDEKAYNQKSSMRVDEGRELRHTCNFFDANLIKKLIGNVIEICKKEDEKFANLKIRNFVSEVIYDQKFIEIGFKYPIPATDQNRAELASAASRWSEAPTKRGKGREDLEELGERLGKLNLKNSGAEFVDLDLRNSDNSEGRFNQLSLEKSRAGFADFDLPFRAGFNNSNSEDLTGGFSVSDSQDLLNTTLQFTAIHNSNNNRNQIGFIDGNNKELQPNYLTNDFDNLDLNNDLKSLNYREEVKSAFPSAVKKTNKYIARETEEQTFCIFHIKFPHKIHGLNSGQFKKKQS